MPAGLMYKSPVPVKVVSKKKPPLKGTKKDTQQDKKIKQIEQKVNKVLFLDEVKFVDTAAAATAIPETGLLINAMNFTTQGDGVSNRDGNKIQATSLMIRAELRTDVDQVVPQRVRMIVCWDTQANGANMVISGLLNTNPLMYASATVPGTFDHRFIQTMDRYKVIHDKLYTLNPQLKLTEAGGTVTDNQPISKNIIKYFKLGRPIEYNGNAGTVADLVKNSINVIFISDLAADQPTVQYNIRLHFKEA